MPSNGKNVRIRAASTKVDQEFKSRGDVKFVNTFSLLETQWIKQDGSGSAMSMSVLSGATDMSIMVCVSTTSEQKYTRQC